MRHFHPSCLEINKNKINKQNLKTGACSTIFPTKHAFNNDAIKENRALCRNATIAEQEMQLQSYKNKTKPPYLSKPANTIKVDK